MSIDLEQISNIYCNREKFGVFKTLEINTSQIEKIEQQFLLKEGHMSYGQPYIIYKLVEKFSPKSILEIGSLYGKSCSIMLEASKESTITCIDTFRYSLDEKNTVPDYFDKFENNTKEYLNRVNVVKDLSTKVHSLFKEGEHDCLFIDGDHSYDGVYKDIVYYHSKLKPGGLIFGHDYPHPMVETFNFNGLMHCVNGLVRDRTDVFYDFGYMGGIWAARTTGKKLK